MKKNGGPAFPDLQFTGDSNRDPSHYLYGGMSLLDWFAGQAMLIAPFDPFKKEHIENPKKILEGIARVTYDLAEVLIEEKRKRENGRNN